MDEADRHRLSVDQHERIFQRDIVPELTAHARSVERPHAVILGGQPGAGKSALQSAVEREFAPSGGVLAIVGDDLRAYHPKYRTLLREDDKRAAFYTDRDAALWIEKLIDHAKLRRFNLVIESTMRLPHKIVATAATLREQGYRVEARALAVPERWSILGIHQRYEQMLKTHGRARFTLQEVHDAAYTGMLQTLDELESDRRVDRLAVYARGNVVLYENSCGPAGWQREPEARRVVEAERARPSSPLEKVEFLQAWQRVVGQRLARGARSEDRSHARSWFDRALVETHLDPAARAVLGKRLGTTQAQALTRAAAAAAFKLLSQVDAVRAFPALAPYFEERERLAPRAPDTTAPDTRLAVQIARSYPAPPARQRSRGRGR